MGSRDPRGKDEKQATPCALLPKQQTLTSSSGLYIPSISAARNHGTGVRSNPQIAAVLTGYLGCIAVEIGDQMRPHEQGAFPYQEIPRPKSIQNA